MLCISVDPSGVMTAVEVSSPFACSSSAYMLETYSPSLTVADYEALFQASLEPIALIGVFYIILHFILNR